MTAQPTGTVTFLFTDLERSTRLWEEHPEAMKGALARHDEILRAAIEARDGYVVKMRGDGVHAAFADPARAVDAAADAQRALASEQWPETGALRVRMGIHTGPVEQRDGDCKCQPRSANTSPGPPPVLMTQKSSSSPANT
jgi:class 3 adenylate cyclase